MNLSQRPGEDQRHTGGKTDDRQLQRRDEIDNFAQHVPKIGLTR
jgi:hypothetical protein